MIVTQHMPGCSAFLSGLPCGCSRTELPDPPTNRGPKCGGCGARLERDRLFCGVCGLKPYRERWKLTGETTYIMGQRYWAYISLATGQQRHLSEQEFSHRTYPPATKIAAWVPVGEQWLLDSNSAYFDELKSHIESNLYTSIARSFDSLMLNGPGGPVSDTERALRRLAQPIDYTTDRQIRKARRRARVVEWWGRLRWKLDGWIMDAPEDYYDEDY
jgi:hypothetical protein